MIYLDYNIGENGQVTSISLNARELSGHESTCTLKDALEKMNIQNPAATFSRKIKSGEYEAQYSEEELTSIAEVANYISDIWQYDSNPQPDNPDIRPYMTPLMLLERALNMLISEMKKRQK